MCVYILNTITALFASAFGALAGSLSAYLLTVIKQKKEEDSQRHSSLLTAQFALISQWTEVMNIKKQLLDTHKDDDNRHLKMIYYMNFGTPLLIDFNSIAFITNSDEPDLLQQVHIAQQKYHAVVGVLDELNQVRLKFYEEAKINVIDINTGAAKLQQVDPKIMHKLKALTDSMYRVVDQALPKLETEKEKLFVFSKRNFPKYKALKTVDL